MEEKRIVAVDLGGTRTRAALADRKGNLLARDVTHTGAEQGPELVILKINSLIRSVMGDLTADQIDSINIASPGPLDSERGIVLAPPNLPGWRDIPLARLVQQAHGITTFIENDAKTAALGEYTFGEYKGTPNMVYITVSTGIGGGVILDGKLVRGHRGLATEIGHMIIDPDGPLCLCGGRGCLEVMASGTAIARQARQLVESGLPTMIDEIAEGKLEDITGITVQRAANSGDVVAEELMRRAAVNLGIGVANTIHLFSPQVVIIGGGVSFAGDMLFEPLRASVNERLMEPFLREEIPVVPASLADDAGLLGAVALALSRG